jgi:hypothetical protein
MGASFALLVTAVQTSAVLQFAISMVASAILSKLLAPKPPGLGDQSNPGSKQQLPPSGSNKLPALYGEAWAGGIITDLTISENNQNIYWVIALCEITNTEPGVSVGAPDEIDFGEVYWGGKRVIWNSPNSPIKPPKNKTEAYDYTQVVGLEDVSTGDIQDVNGYMNIYLYANGSTDGYNTSQNAYDVLSNANLTKKDQLIYTWDTTKLMSNCAFAIVHLKYNAKRGTTSLNQTRFQIFNSRSSPGDCFTDYLKSSRYGAGIPTDQIDTASFDALNTYSNQIINYTDYAGNLQVQKRYVFNGTLDTDQKLMTNIQTMSDCCNSLIRYNEVLSKWGVVVQSPNYSVAMIINDSNIIGPITVSPIDISNSFNIIEVAFADNVNKDSFTTASFDLAELNPSLLFPNEPVNKQTVQLNLVNNSVQAQYIANSMLEAAREDLQVQCEINYYGLQLQAGDIVTLTNTNYGWDAKLFRITKVTQKFSDKGEITASLNLSEFTPAVFDDKNVTQFIPSPNTGIGSPTTFGIIPAPEVISINPSAIVPYFTVQITTSSNGITQYAELWYSAYEYPTSDQLIFATTSQIQANGDPYSISEVLPDLNVSNIPSGNWYLFSRMVNGLGTSPFSPASSFSL